MMQTREAITQAYHRLLNHLASDDEKSDPLKFPPEGELMNRAVQEAADPSIGTEQLRAALEQAGRDQHNALSREINVVERLRERGVSWRGIAQHRGLESAQAAKQRYRRLTEPPEVAIYAFRAAGDPGAPWHGDPGALDSRDSEAGEIDFNPATPRPFSGRTLQVRYGPVLSEIMPGYLRAYAQVNGRRIPLTAAIQRELFGG